MLHVRPSCLMNRFRKAYLNTKAKLRISMILEESNCRKGKKFNLECRYVCLRLVGVATRL